MIGMIVWGERYKRGEVETLSGVCFYKITLPRGKVLAPLCARRAASFMRRKGVKTTVFVKGFPYTDIFEKQGVFPCDFRPVRLFAAPQIAAMGLQKEGIDAENAFLAVRATRVSEEVEKVVTELSGRVRYLSLEAEGAEEFSKKLRFQKGISLRADRFGAQLTLDLRVGTKSGEGVLALFDRSLSVRYAEEAPFGVETEQFLAAICAKGAKKEEKIVVLGID